MLVNQLVDLLAGLVRVLRIIEMVVVPSGGFGVFHQLFSLAQRRNFSAAFRLLSLFVVEHSAKCQMNNI